MELNENIINKWQEMTEWNDHTGVVLDMAHHFGYVDIVAEFEEIRRVHRERGHILLNEVMKRSELTNKMLDRIEAEYGKSVRKQVEGCL